MYAAALAGDLESIPTGEPTGVKDFASIAGQAADAMIDMSHFRVWTWEVGGDRLHEETLRFRIGWSFVHQLGSGPNPSFALTAPGAIGLVLPDGGDTPYEKLSRPPPQSSEDVIVEVAVKHLCDVLAVESESRSVAGSFPDGAHSGDLC